MTHLRKQIRDFTIAALETSAELVALSPRPAIEASRSVAVDAAALPRIIVYLRGETTDGGTLTKSSPREYDVTAELVVEYISRLKLSDGAFEDDLDTAAEALEPIFDRLETSRFGGLVRKVRYLESEPVGQTDGSQQAFSLRMKYELSYGRIVAPVLPNDFLTNAIEYLVGDASPDDNPTDSITLPQ